MKKLLITLLLLSVYSEAYHDFDFEQIKEDNERIEATEFRMDFNIENPKHKYFVVMNVLDIASTLYAIENRDILVEANPLLPEKPELEEIYVLEYFLRLSSTPRSPRLLRSGSLHFHIYDVFSFFSSEGIFQS